MIGEETLKLLDKSLERDLKQQLRDQGHYLTGTLERSVEPDITNEKNQSVLEITAEDYIDDLETGIPANQIDISDPVYIAGLTRYAELRFGYHGRRALKAAYAIAKKHAREGMPTAASYAYSKTGQRTFAIIDTYTENEKEYDEIIEVGVDTEIDQFIDKTFKQTIF